MADITVNLLETQNFYQLPKIFFSRTENVKDERGNIIGKIRQTSPYAKMSNDAKIAYGIFYDRCQLSMKKYAEGSRQFVDENGSVFMVYTVEDLMDLLNLSKGTVIKIKKELVNKGLLREVRQGMNRPNRLYLQLVESKHQMYEYLDQEKKIIAVLPHQDRSLFKNLSQEQEVSESLDFTGSSNFGLPKDELPEVQKLNPSDTEKSNTESNIISSRKAEQNSNEFSQPAGTDEPSSQDHSVGFVQPQYYSLLQPIAQAYNDRVFGFPEWWTMTHQQKMTIGQYLQEGYILSNEVIGFIQEIPNDSPHPFAYLVKCLDNLKEERRLEAKIYAQRQAEAHYQQKGMTNYG